MLDIHVPTVASPSIVPDETIDRAHLFKMTLGDHSLEGEVLRLFDRQCRMLLERMKGADANCVKALAHTIDGSARGVGAWRVARAACAVEIAANGGADTAAAIQMLAREVDDTLVMVADLLRVH